MEKTRKVGRIFLASDEKVVDVLAAESYAPIWSCCSCEFWINLCSVCCATICFLTTLCIKPNCVCKWNIHRENYTSVLVLTNRRIIRYKDSNGSASLKNPQRYSHQQIHLSAVGSSESHYAQALPDSLLGRCFMLCGCCTSCCHVSRVASLKFQTKYPKVGISESGFALIYANSKLDCFLGPLGYLNVFGLISNLFRFMWKCLVFAFMAAFIQPGIALLEYIGIIKPSTEVIIFEELLSSFRDRVENLGHDSSPADIKRYDNFLKNFNLFRSQYQDLRKMPPLNTDSFDVQHDQTWEDAYNTPVCDLMGLGNRIFVNSHSTGLVTGSEDVIDAINVTQQATCIDWLKCCMTCGCYFCGFIAPMRAFKQFFVFTTHRAMKVVIFSGNNTSGVYGTMNAYTRTVTSWYDCTPTKGARFELNEALCCSAGRGCSCCSCCNTPINACMDISTDFGVFKLDIVSKKEIYDKVQAIFSYLVKQYECKTAFGADKVGPHVAQHSGLSNREQVFGAECNQSSLGNINLRDMMAPLTRDQESIHAGVYQYGDWHMSGSAGGAESCFKKYICPDKFWWHSGMAVTEHKILAYYNRCSSAERISNISISMIPADKIKASAFYHTAQSFSFQCFECCCKTKNLSGENPLDPAGNLESYAYGIMRAEIHVGTGSGASVNFGQTPSKVAVANGMATPHPVTFFGAELTQHSAHKLDGASLPDLSPKEIELQRLYAVLSAVSYLANQKAIKNEISAIPAMVPSYNSTDRKSVV